jgi:hypothetical protein
MKTKLTLLFMAAALLAGCSSAGMNKTGPKSAPGKISVRLELGYLGTVFLTQPARLYADSSFICNCGASSRDVVLQLPQGKHKISIEIPKAQQKFADGRYVVLTLSGGETVEVLGPESTQLLIFGEHNLKQKLAQ